MMNILRYPLLNNNKNIFVYACDFSTDAIQLLKSNESYDEKRCYGFVCDLTKENSLSESLPENVKVDIVTLIFVLSAIHPTKMRTAVQNIAKVSKICLRVLFFFSTNQVLIEIRFLFHLTHLIEYLRDKYF